MKVERGISLSLTRVPRVTVEMYKTFDKRDEICQEEIYSRLFV
jgi:hypothetical protein